MLNERPVLVLLGFLIFTTAILVSGAFFVVRASGHIELMNGASEFVVANGNSALTDPAQAAGVLSLERQRPLVTGEKKTPRVKLRRHKIHTGENLWMIARQYGVDINTILGCNEELSEQGQLLSGREIIIPNQKGVFYTIRFGQTLSDISAAYNVRLTAICRANGIANAKYLKSGDAVFIPEAEPLAPNSKQAKLLESFVHDTTFLMPLKGRFTARFGWRIHPIRKRREFHKGIDIAAYWGAKVKAAQGGKVIFADWKSGYGYFVKIKHDFDYVTCYGHLTSPMMVKAGDKVKRGQVIGRTGNTGASTGSHLHFEVRKGKKAVNPFRYVRF